MYSISVVVRSHWKRPRPDTSGVGFGVSLCYCEHTTDYLVNQSCTGWTDSFRPAVVLPHFIPRGLGWNYIEAKAKAALLWNGYITCVFTLDSVKDQREFSLSLQNISTFRHTNEGYNPSASVSRVHEEIHSVNSSVWTYPDNQSKRRHSVGHWAS